jgi:hypothetical protein
LFYGVKICSIFDTSKSFGVKLYIIAKKTEYLFSPDCKGFSSEQTWEVNGVVYYYSFICLQEEFDFSDRHHTILSHEVIHACTHHLKSMFDIVTENEAFAYTHTHILNQCYEVLRRKPTKFI